MKPKIKKILKWFGGIALAIVLLFALAVYTLVCFERENFSRYSYCYFVCISPEIKNVPLIGLVGNPRYSSNVEKIDDGTEYNATRNVSFTSNGSEEDLISETETFLNTIGFKKVKYNVEETISGRSVFVRFKREDSEMLLATSVKAAVDVQSEAGMKRVFISQQYNISRHYDYKGER